MAQLYCSGVQNGRMPIAKLAPKMDIGTVETNMATNTIGNWYGLVRMNRVIRRVGGVCGTHHIVTPSLSLDHDCASHITSKFGFATADGALTSFERA